MTFLGASQAALYLYPVIIHSLSGSAPLHYNRDIPRPLYFILILLQFLFHFVEDNGILFNFHRANIWFDIS
jgi:hypothetical protein